MKQNINNAENQMIKFYDRKVPALLQSKTSLTDSISISVNREFIEGYVLKGKWVAYNEGSPVLITAKPAEIGGVDEYIKVKVMIDDNPTA